MNKAFVVIGILLLLGGGLLAMISISTTIDETIPAFDDLPQIFLLPETSLSLPVGETVTARFDISGTAPQRDVRIGLTTESLLDSVLMNSSIVDETFTAEGFYVYILGTAEADEGGLFTFSWFVASGAPVLFGVFDTDGYLIATDLLTIDAFQDNALVWGSLSDGIGYFEASMYDDYFFLLFNTNESDEEVTAEVFQLTIAAIPYLDSTEGTTQATFTYDISSKDDYRLVVELPDGAYEVAAHGELAPHYPYQLYGFLLLGIGAIIALLGFLVKSQTAEYTQPI
jgi:hypothetical protein